MKTYRVAVFGASGYTGGELLRYLGSHPGFDLVWATADRNAGRTVGEVFGHLPALEALRLEAADADPPSLDLAFLALPHGGAAAAGRELASAGTRVVDLSADWRLQDPAAYEDWYGGSHPHPEELSGWVYGLPELHRAPIAEATRVANPGCYPTAAILPLAPLLDAGVIGSDGIVIDAASGVSGAGRKVDVAYLFGELDSSYAAYGVGRHRHTPEIEQELSRAAGRALTVTFTPHLAPMTRGLLATCYAPLRAGVADAYQALGAAYAKEQFVHVLPEGRQPTTKQAAGSNLALIGVGAEERTGTLVVTCAIDNLGKGAAGQAVQNANLMCGLDEDTGLATAGVYP